MGFVEGMSHQNCNRLWQSQAGFRFFFLDNLVPAKACIMRMRSLHILSTVEQVAEHLSEEMRRGALVNEMPGAWNMAAELGVDHKTIQAAMGLLERKGLLRRRGAGRRRKIVLPKRFAAPGLQVKILLREPEDWRVHYMVNARDSLSMAGHTAEFADKSLLELKMDVQRVARYVKRTPADAWVVTAGSREMLEWFASQPIPSFALFGRLRGVPIAGAGTIKAPVMVSLIRRLGALGHRRIVLLLRAEHRGLNPNQLVVSYLEELEALGIRPGPYNLPNWEETPKGLQQCLGSIFRNTPPTVLIVEELGMFYPVLHFLNQCGIKPPDDISLVCLDPIPSAEWYNPMVSHLRFGSRPLIHRMVKWAGNVARGKDDRRQTLAQVDFVEGGTIGPVPRKK